MLKHGEVSFDGSTEELLSDIKFMKANSLDLPDTTKLAVRLSQYGVPNWYVKTEDLERALKELVGKSNGN